MSNNVFFVSAFITNIHKNDKSIDNYISYSKKMINIGMNQLIFLEKHVFKEHFKEYDNEIINVFEYENEVQFEYIHFNNIYFIFFEKQNIYLYDHIADITDFQIITDNPNKDTIEYMFVQCHKTEWIKMATFFVKQKEEINIDCAEFIWIDFGIYHIIKNEELFEREIKNLNERVLAKLNDGIRIGGCWNLNLKYNVNLYKQISWYFAGGLFGGSPENLIKFSELMKSKCLEIIKEKKTFIWEVNIWYLIYLENPDLFNCYMAGHDTSMITNY
jgi:hypothetical protein